MWNRLYSISDLDDPARPAYEDVATLVALAVTTTGVRVGCLVFCVGSRNPGVLRKAAVTILSPATFAQRAPNSSSAT
ncbi:MAG: hypothetical protein IT294_00255 [Deltaproteobacteria bacterium]|nr:hypothetical protein [Deltaproteobacteria bacterium]